MLEIIRKTFPNIPENIRSQIEYKQDSEDESLDLNEEFRNKLIECLSKQLFTTDYELCKYLLKHSISAHEQSWGVSHEYKMCVYMVAIFKSLDDIFLIDDAIWANSDTPTSLDAQLLLQNGKENTSEYLKRINSPEANEIIKYIIEEEKWKDLSDKALKKWVPYYGSGIIIKKSA